MIKNIVFDVGKVLVSFEPEQMLEKLGYDENVRKNVMKAVFSNPLWRENDRGVLSTEELTDAFVANAPEYELQIREAFAKVGDTIELMPYAMEWLEELKTQGYHLYVLSNYGEYTYQKTEHKLTFLSLMDGAIFSFRYQTIKPEREIYERLLQEFGLKAEESVFLDDCPENVEAAKEAGFYGIQFRDYKQAKAELNQVLQESISIDNPSLK